MPMSDSYLAPSNRVAYTFPSKPDEVSILAPNCLNIEFRYKVFKNKCQIRIQHLQIEWCADSQVNFTRS